MTDKELEKWIRQYGRDIYSFCIHITHNVHDADELYQDVWLQVMKKLPKIEADGNVKAYCLGAAVRLWKSKCRKFARRSRIAPEIPLEYEGGTERPADSSAEPEQICMEKLTAAQIGKVMGVPEGTVKSRLSVARHLPAEELGDLYEK